MTTTAANEVYRLVQVGRKAERRRKALGKFLGRLLVRILVALLNGWFFMLGIGVVHHDWWPAVPPIGYWTACLVVILLGGTLGAARLTQEREGADR